MRTVSVLISVLALAAMQAAGADDYRKLFRAVDPAVVVVYTVERSVTTGGPVEEVALPGVGSGFLVDDQGHVMTAAHVVQTADLVEVEFASGEKTTAAIVASDPMKDVALLKLDAPPRDIDPLTLADSDRVEVGQEVFVIGAPLGLAHTLTVGHVSARHRVDDGGIGLLNVETFQTDAAINRGNSGGPLFNRRGEVIGIVSHIRSVSGGSEGLGFAVTSNAAVDALYHNRMSWSGLSGSVVTGQLARALNVPQRAGYLVQKVAINSPAERIGLRPSRLPATIAGQEMLIGGDIILSVAGVAVAPGMAEDIRTAITKNRSSGVLMLTVLRGGSVIELAAPLN